MTEDDNQLKRVRWRCRRGTRELDVLLGRFIDRAWPTLDADTRARVEAFLIEVQDPDLYNWLMRKTESPEATEQAMVELILPHIHA